MNYLIAAAGEKAGLGHVHPHMLRHSCGHALADKGTDLRTMQDYLGHRDRAMTVRYKRWLRFFEQNFYVDKWSSYRG